LKEFESVDIGIISNARCLTEGVNIPAVDMVAFIDPKRSLIDIVQATGRAMRKAEWKESGYIFIPVFLEEDADPEEIIKNSDFGTVWEVLEAMLDQDQRMQGIVSKMRVLQGKGEQDSQAWKDAMTEYGEKIEFYDLPIKIDQNRFIERLNTKIVEIIGRSWDFYYGLTLKYKDEFDNPNVQQGYKTVEGYQLGSWQSEQRKHYKKGILSSVRIERLEDIGFTWDLFDEKFEKGFQETLLYKERTGNPNAPGGYKTAEGFTLGTWQQRHRYNYRQGTMSPERIKQLEEIGFTWEILEEQFEKGFQETLLYKERAGHPDAPTTYKTAEGYELGHWQTAQRSNYKKKKLSPERVKRFEKIGFTWDINAEQFEKGFQETVLYKEKTGNSNAPKSYKTPEGYPLGQWQSHQKEYYRKGKLSPKRIKRFEEIGFTWDINAEQFEKGFQETLLYKGKTGNPNVPNRHMTDEGYPLRIWQATQRDNYKKGNLFPDKIKRLDDIGFSWVLLNNDIKFEKGFQETFLYKERTGNPNVSQSYMTPEGYPLGIWQSNHKCRYKKGKLPPDRTKRLEDINFIWDILDEKFEKGFKETVLYKEKTGNPNAPKSCKTSEGYPLGIWQTNQRNNYRKGRLSPDKIKRLDEIGFKGYILDEQFEKGFQETFLYNERTGNPNAPQSYITPEGYPLGIWQNSQRGNYKRGKLFPARIKYLGDIGFKWKLQEKKSDEQFEKGFKETVLYKEKTANPNAPTTYKTNEGYQLGYWQTTQRGNYKKGKLSPDRIKRLEDIGFKWRRQK